MEPAGTAAERDFREGLIQHGHIIPSGVPGVFGRGEVFEDVLDRFNRLIAKVGAPDHAEKVHFPPVVSRTLLERSEFLDSFPQLAGSVFSFDGTDAQHRELIERVHGGDDWSELQTMTDTVLSPAACYPLYPSFTGTLPANGRTVDLTSYCFRHEPSPDPARMQVFRVHGIVRAGDHQTVLDWRESWMQRGLGLLKTMGLPATIAPASDPFFGRGGKFLALNQKDQGLKFEILVPICSAEKPTAVVSFNYHRDHFSSIFDIKTAAGEPAKTGCLGFGLERVVMALFKTHGFSVNAWPVEVRRKLWA